MGEQRTDGFKRHDSSLPFGGIDAQASAPVRVQVAMLPE
jgi:hypothetical protein